MLLSSRRKPSKGLLRSLATQDQSLWGGVPSREKSTTFLSETIGRTESAVKGVTHGRYGFLSSFVSPSRGGAGPASRERAGSRGDYAGDPEAFKRS